MKLSRRVACVALLGGILGIACNHGMALAVPAAQSEAEEAAAAAHAALERLPAEARLREIKNERLRRAIQATYRAVVELADNHEARKVAALNSRFENAYNDVWREAARSEHQNCAANCQALDGQQCLTNCNSAGKKFCGCKLVVFGCIVAECIF